MKLRMIKIEEIRNATPDGPLFFRAHGPASGAVYIYSSIQRSNNDDIKTLRIEGGQWPHSTYELQPGDIMKFQFSGNWEEAELLEFLTFVKNWPESESEFEVAP